MNKINAFFDWFLNQSFLFRLIAAHLYCAWPAWWAIQMLQNPQAPINWWLTSLAIAMSFIPAIFIIIAREKRR